MSRSYRRRLLLGSGPVLGVVLASVALVVSNHVSTQLNMGDPEAVARAYYLTLYQCGEQGAGARYDLSTSTQRTWSRDEFLKIERRSGCEPAQTPSIDVRTVTRVEDQAVVLITGRGISVPLVLILDDGGAWRVDTLRTHQPERVLRETTV